MELVSTIADIIRDLLIFVVAMSVLLVALIVFVSRMPHSNPLKRLLTAVCYRVGATVAAGLIAIPIEPIPGIDAVYDLAVLVGLVWYWITLFREPAASNRRRRSGRRNIGLRQHEEALQQRVNRLAGRRAP